MDAILAWATDFVATHPQIASVLIVILAVDQVLKVVKNTLKLNIPETYLILLVIYWERFLAKHNNSPQNSSPNSSARVCYWADI